MRAPVGGPSSKVPFEAVWPEMFPPAALRKIYKRLNNPATYSANYMCQPMSDEMKIVREVRMLDIDDPATKRLLETAENHMSVDPAAKGDGSGDKAGLVVLALGDLITQHDGQFGITTNRETLGVVRVAREFDATQFELMDEMRRVAEQLPIHIAHIECVTGLGSAIVEALQRYHNVSSVNPINASSSKRQRFKAVAGMIENADPLLPAKIAFLGRRPRDEHGRPIAGAKLEPLPEYEKILSYIINYAVEEGFHSLDSLTQVCKENLYTLGPSAGAFSAQSAQSDRPNVDPRKKKYAEAVRRKAKHTGRSRRGGYTSTPV